MSSSRIKRTPKSGATQDDALRVVELFAGVGGFRLGLSGERERNKDQYRTVWFNQWEPSTKKQHAHEVYLSRFKAAPGEERTFTNTDIAEAVKATQNGDFNLPDHDLLVGGFPCQDYSVARTLSQATGIAGKKGVLWWEIRNILELKLKQKRPVKYVFLENVDRLLKSPATQRGRDFAIILATLSDLGYFVEWRVVNAADYGMPQRRRRTFIVGYHSSSAIHKAATGHAPEAWLLQNGVIAKALPVDSAAGISKGEIAGTYADITDQFNKENPTESPFGTAGMMHGRTFHTAAIAPRYKGKATLLKDIVLDEKDVPAEYFINKADMKQWKYLKGAKNEPRKGTDGFTFTYTEGPMSFPDSLDKPSRTIITAEGGISPSRFKHVIKTQSGKYRRLTPLELERLCMFPDNHTEHPEIGDSRRAFFMGNALVVGVVRKIGKSLRTMHDELN